VRKAVVLTVCGAAVLARGGGGDAPNASNFGQMFASAICGSERRCCTQSGLTPTGDGKACVQVETGVPTMYGYNPSDSVFNADTAALCLQAASSYTCGSTLIIDQIHRLCTFAYTGQTPVGGGCTWNSDCQQPAGGHAVCTATKCAVTDLFGKEGAPCDTSITTNTPFVCAFWEGYRCVYDDTALRTICRKRNAAGAACSTISDCMDGTYCDPDALMCAPERKLNEPCDDASSPCGYGLTCTNGMCAGTC
jgi:hypothetical protein